MKSTWNQVHGRRLARGCLLGPAHDAVEAAAAACGVHAQIHSAAELSLSARVERLRSPWGTWLGHAALASELVSGPSLGTAPTFVQPERAGPEPPAGEALREALRRYLAAYGPARRQDFATWLGISPATAKALFEAAADELEPVEVEGARAFLDADLALGAAF